MAPRIKLIVKSQRSWDDWVSQDRLRKLTDENKELASNLKKDMDALRNRNAKPSVSHKKKVVGTDSSLRGSEERHSSVAAAVPPRGQKRNRDWETEKVCFCAVSSAISMCPSRVFDASTACTPWHKNSHVKIAQCHLLSEYLHVYPV